LPERRTSQTFVCKGCQQVITRAPSPARDNRKEYCSNACKLRVWWKTHEKKTSAPSAQYLERIEFERESNRQASLKRKQERKIRSEGRRLDRRYIASIATAIRTCRVCGGTFVRPPFRPGTWNLCSACKPLAAKECRRRHRQVYGKKPAERARRRGLPSERCGPIAVCTRDKWRCRLCGVSTPRSLRGTYHIRAPEVDHIIPLSHPQSPGHVWSNVQCLCRQCNLDKGARIRGQLRLAV
jgi:5-methylcytosine-specific restriction endonuclease McrA